MHVWRVEFPEPPVPGTELAVSASDVEAEVHHVAVLHHVFLALDADLAGLLGLAVAAGGDEVGVGHDFGGDELLQHYKKDHSINNN